MADPDDIYDPPFDSPGYITSPAGVAECMAKPWLSGPWEKHMEDMASTVVAVNHVPPFSPSREKVEFLFLNGLGVQVDQKRGKRPECEAFELRKDQDFEPGDEMIFLRFNDYPDLPSLPDHPRGISFAGAIQYMHMICAIDRPPITTLPEPKERIDHYRALRAYGYAKQEAQAIVANLHIGDDQMDEVVARHCAHKAERDLDPEDLIEPLRVGYPNS